MSQLIFELNRYETVRAICTLETGVSHAAKSAFQLAKQSSPLQGNLASIISFNIFPDLVTEISGGS